MTASSKYFDQVQLLMDVLPTVRQESSLALKGGTAINLFYRDMPRLSVDIDLLWLPVADRSSSLKEIDETLNRITLLITDRNPRITAKRLHDRRIGLPQIFVERDQVEIKIETSTVARGTVMPTCSMTTSDSVTQQFGLLRMNVVSFEDVYAGKIAAALDRKHPRDLFDIMILYENEGISDKLFRVFMVYAASSRRPMHELLAPTKPVREDWYDNLFEGMNLREVSLNALTETGQRLHKDVVSRLTGKIVTFLLSLHDAEPDFGLIGLPNAAELPAVRWKLFNLEKLKQQNPEKHAEQRRALERLFR